MMIILDARFTFTDKWHGESHIDRYSLHVTVKLQPLIILLDEIRKPMKPKIYLNYIQEISLYYRVQISSPLQRSII
jgi:hypothetical protein